MLSPKTVFLALLLSTSSLALPIRREVPQEHSHQQFLTTVQASLVLNNPDNIQDSVFGLLGNAAAIAGAGKITDATCLQQATADQAFTNAKAAGDVNGQVAALIYRALERNSGTVGGVTAPCTSIKAVNPEIAAIQQHQDPASANAAATNKAITLALAQQIAAVGGNAQDALKAGTFAPGNPNDNTGKGNTCDDANDAVGCIFSQNLLVEDATADEITAAVAGIGSAASSGAATSGSAADSGAASGSASSTYVDPLTLLSSQSCSFSVMTVSERSLSLPPPRLPLPLTLSPQLSQQRATSVTLARARFPRSISLPASMVARRHPLSPMT
ncbi:hypothetical protein FB45DRAFT_735408 [Roridomyces roridus]|uniref:Cell wall protein n=1 Tax=Roridomyces roridus TaxID=1738132 RepID=A0AAD7CAY5_9AGAR|nr:hypothetical protein FB45DRAFT_735408 [Roridomyces roridus]